MSEGTEGVAVTRDYYNSADADNFYFHVWGGEDIHIGIYEQHETDIARASRRTVERMLERIPSVGPATRVLDLGAGFGGAARHLARATGCHVTALNLSATENARAAAMSAAAGLADKIAVVEGSYEDLPFTADSFDVVWSQDALLHSDQRDRIFGEVARVLRPGGQFIFTDPMDSGRGARADLQPVLDRIHLTSMGSFGAYTKAAISQGLKPVALVDLSAHLPRHYTLVRDQLRARQDELSAQIAPDFMARMLVGLDHWIRAGDNRSLAWGILHFAKP